MTSLKTALSTIGERGHRAAPSWYSGDGRMCIHIVRTDVPKLLAVIDRLIEQRNWLIENTTVHAFVEDRIKADDASLLAILAATESKGELKV